MRMCREVAIERDLGGSGITVLSDAAVPAGEELTLFLAGAAGDLELRVAVVAARPQVIGGALRHRLLLSILSVAPVTGQRACDAVEP